jgi:glycosyltransferase involved in cell wall biosynthesis
VDVYSKTLAEKFRAYFGERSAEKRFPLWFFNLPTRIIANFVKGMWLGDGCVVKRNNRYTDMIYTTASRTLAFQLFFLLLKLGILPSIEETVQVKGSFAAGRVRYRVKVSGRNMRRLYSLLFGGETSERNKEGKDWSMPFIWGNYVLFPIRAVRRVPFEGYVYNLEVEGAESYVVNGMTVHNCVEASLCGTPVVAFENGALPEIVAEGVNGYLVRTYREMLEAVRRVLKNPPEPGKCREAGERFHYQRVWRDFREMQQF